jgi:hypothetical protein
MDVNFVFTVGFLIDRWHDFYSKENIDSQKLVSIKFEENEPIIRKCDEDKIIKLNLPCLNCHATGGCENPSIANQSSFTEFATIST